VKCNGTDNEVARKIPKEDFAAKLECGHQFQSICIYGWMINNNQCPICREKIEK